MSLSLGKANKIKWTWKLAVLWFHLPRVLLAAAYWGYRQNTFVTLWCSTVFLLGDNESQIYVYIHNIILKVHRYYALTCLRRSSLGIITGIYCLTVL